MSEKICPLMSMPLPDHTFFLIHCHKEKCMAWGICQEIAEVYDHISVDNSVVKKVRWIGNEYGCKLIERNN